MGGTVKLPQYCNITVTGLARQNKLFSCYGINKCSNIRGHSDVTAMAVLLHRHKWDRYTLCPHITYIAVLITTSLMIPALCTPYVINWLKQIMQINS